uniref:DNA polymerase IV n=1 Tax=uncultured planctomycete 3FN TaxID=455066 RepID=A9LGX4_9BACT|nr:DNA-directed DNA polymerase IV [uncultured planctomycete 3FN]
MIVHVDMDAFYASIEERDRPELRGLPVIVGGDAQRRGVVSAANYVARSFGVHSAMPAATAKRLCPQGVFLPTRMPHYVDVSCQIREIFGRFTPLVEPLALDEAFLDVTGSSRLFGPPEEIGRTIKTAIHDELQLVASVGIAPNKFLAKLASDLDKPDGFVVVNPKAIHAFLDPLPVTRLWGVGKAAARKLDLIGIQHIAQLRALPRESLADNFGASGDQLWLLANGIDDRDVIPDRDAKSISHETTFAVDVDDMERLRGVLAQLTEQVARRVRAAELRGRTVQLKIRYSDFQTYTRSTKLSQPTDVTDEIWQAAQSMLATRLPERTLAVRLLGIGVSQLDRSKLSQRSLFDDDQRQRSAQLDAAKDKIRNRFGRDSLDRGSSLE